MKKNGFTLIELMGVIVLLGILGLIIVPVIDKTIKSGKQDLFETQIKNIEMGAQNWASNNIFNLPENEGDVVTLTLGQLKQAGLAEKDIKDPIADRIFPNTMIITITKGSYGYDYKVDRDTITYTDTEDVLDVDVPIIALIGNPIEYVEATTNNNIYTTTTDLSDIIATDYNDNNITSTVIKKIYGNSVNGSLFSDIDSIKSRIGRYVIEYSVTGAKEVATVAYRTVIVRDTTPPTLTVPANTTITVSQAPSYNLGTGFSATDVTGVTNSSYSPTSVPAVVGKHTITYQAKDGYGNAKTKTRIITVN